MKQLFINISFTTILFALILNINYCKKNNTIEPEPVNNNPTVSGEYNNEITGDKLIFEINDMIYAKGSGKIADSRPYDGFTKMSIGLYDQTSVN